VGEGTDKAARQTRARHRATRPSHPPIRGLPEPYSPHSVNRQWNQVADIRAASLPDVDHVSRGPRVIDSALNSETSLPLSSA